MVEIIIYILSLAFQLSAGILLLIGNTSTKKEKVVRKYCEAHRCIEVRRDGTLKNYDELWDVARVAWINKFAFLYLIIGYLINIFGKSPNQKVVAFVFVIFLCVLFTVIAYKIAQLKMKKYNLINFNEYILSKGTMTIEE